MKDFVIKITIAGMLAFAVYGKAMAMFFAAAGITAAILLSRSAGIGTKLTMVLVGALAGGLGGEIVRTVWQHSTSPELANSSHFLDAMLVSMICAMAALVAVFCDRQLRRLISRGN